MKNTNLYIVQPHFRRTDEEVTVEEHGLYHNVTGQNIGGHHLTLRSSLDQTLPGVGGVRDNETKVEIPFFEAPPFKENLRVRSTSVISVTRFCEESRVKVRSQNGLLTPFLLLTQRERRSL